MLEEAEIAKRFEALLNLEQQAEQLYSQLAQQALDPNIRRQLDDLRRRKQRHIRLTERLLEIVSG